MRRKGVKKAIHRCACEGCRTHPYSAEAADHRAINRLLATFNEKYRRRFVGFLALEWGRGSIEKLASITGMSRNTIRRGRTEVKQVEGRPMRDKVRQPGGGRLAIEKNSRRW